MTKQSSPKKPPLGRRAAYLERQRLVAGRAERRALAELDGQHPPASWRDYLLAGIRHGRDFPDQLRARRQRGGR